MTAWRLGWMLVAAAPRRTAWHMLATAGLLWTAALLDAMVWPDGGSAWHHRGLWWTASAVHLVALLTAAALVTDPPPRNLPVSASTGAQAALLPTALAAAAALAGAGLVVAFPDAFLDATLRALGRWPPLPELLWPSHTRLGPSGATASVGLAPLVFVARQCVDFGLASTTLAWHRFRFDMPAHHPVRALWWGIATVVVAAALDRSMLTVLAVSSAVATAARAPDLFFAGRARAARWSHSPRRFVRSAWAATLRDAWSAWQRLLWTAGVVFVPVMAVMGWAMSMLLPLDSMSLAVTVVPAAVLIATPMAIAAATLAAAFLGPAPAALPTSTLVASGAFPIPAWRLVITPLLVATVGLPINLAFLATGAGLPAAREAGRPMLLALWTVVWFGWWLHAKAGPVRWLHMLATVGTGVAAGQSLSPGWVAVHAAVSAASAIHVVRRGH